MRIIHLLVVISMHSNKRVQERDVFVVDALMMIPDYDALGLSRKKWSCAKFGAWVNFCRQNGL